MFTVVHFTSEDDNSVQIVPSTWVNHDLNICRWPIGPKAQRSITTLVKNSSPVEENWSTFSVRVMKLAGIFLFYLSILRKGWQLILIRTFPTLKFQKINQKRRKRSSLSTTRSLETQTGGVQHLTSSLKRN